jgi:hypothetical protein
MARVSNLIKCSCGDMIAKQQMPKHMRVAHGEIKPNTYTKSPVDKPGVVVFNTVNNINNIINIITVAS